MSEGSGSQRYCRNCGAEVRAGTQFCVSCGTTLDQRPTSPDPANSVPPPPAPSRSLSDTPQETTRGSDQRSSDAHSGSSETTGNGLLNRIINWFRDLPSTPKLILMGIVLLLVLVFLSPLGLIAAAVLLGVSVLILIYRVFERKSVKSWGIVAATSLILVFVFGSLSSSIYGVGSSNNSPQSSGKTGGTTTSVDKQSDKKGDPKPVSPEERMMQEAEIQRQQNMQKMFDDADRQRRETEAMFEERRQYKKDLEEWEERQKEKR